MPWIIVQALAGRRADQKRELARRITEAVVEVYEVLPANVTVRFQDSAPGDLAKGGVLFSDRPDAAEGEDPLVSD
jgi:4-oxalocrotonate tautomerase